MGTAGLTAAPTTLLHQGGIHPPAPMIHPQGDTTAVLAAVVTAAVSVAVAMEAVSAAVAMGAPNMALAL